MISVAQNDACIQGENSFWGGEEWIDVGLRDFWHTCNEICESDKDSGESVQIDGCITSDT